MSPTKILIVVESIDVDDSSGAKGRVALINNLKRAGFNLVVYHYTRKDFSLKGIPCFAIKEKRRSLLFFLSRAERLLRDRLKINLYRPLQNLFGFSFTLLNDRNSIVAALTEIDFEPDLVITLSKGGSFRPHHALLKLPLWHPKWISYMHDPYPMHHYPKPFTWREPGAQKKEAFIKSVSENCRYAAFPSLLLKDWMGKFYPEFKKKGIVIPHQIEERKIYSGPFPYFFNNKNFNILHAGNLLGARNPMGLIEGYILFLSNVPEAKEDSSLIFLGGNNKRVDSVAQGNENIFASKFYVPFEQVYMLQTNADVNIILEAKAPISPFLPGKFPHCIQAKKPILLLGPVNSEAKRLLGDEYPYWAEIDDSYKISRLIEKLYIQWKDTSGKLELKRQDLIDYLGPEHLKDVIESINY